MVLALAYKMVPRMEGISETSKANGLKTRNIFYPDTPEFWGHETNSIMVLEKKK